MGDTDLLFEIEINIAAEGVRDACQALYRQLRAAIAGGRLPAGSKLPPTRKSKTIFGVSRNTAAEAYEKLQNEGYVIARHGSGTYVAGTLPTGRSDPPPDRYANASARRLNEYWLRPEVTQAMGFWWDGPQRPSHAPNSRGLDFRPGIIDSRLFPFALFRRVIAKQLRALERKPVRYKSPQGNQGNHYLREAIAGYIALTRAVVCRPDDIIITSGAQQAFDLLSRILVTPNRTVVAVEDPGYPPMRVPFAAAGARLVPVAIDAEGMIIEQIPQEANVICVCPSHQFPLGVTMSARRRKALVEFARHCGAVVIEDDYDGEFRYDGMPLQALRSPESADAVFYVGTFSKCMLPALRLGFIVAPDWVMRPLITAKNSLDWHCPTPLQLGVFGFIAGGHLARHVRKMRAIYKMRRERLLTALNGGLSEWMDPLPSFYGMHVTAVTRTSLDLDRVAEVLLQKNMKIHTLSRFCLGPQTRTGLVFGYGTSDFVEIDRGLSLLRKAISG